MKYAAPLICFLLFQAFFSTGLRAQTTAFPVTLAAQSLPPFTPSLSDWADPTTNRLGLTLLLNDREEPGYQVRLRLRISGQGIELRTSPLAQPVPITLNFGQPVQLTSADLRAYFEIDNLDFIGYSRQAYLDNGGLPSGTYSICFEAVDYDRGTEEAASREACTFVQASLLDPPVILSPIGSVLPVNPQNLVVQWQARHTASFITNYDVEIFTIDPLGGLTAEQIFSIQQPDIETTTMGVTTALIDNSFPALQRGQTYFARVRAYDANGSNAFNNGGYSELAFFTYGEACAPPEGLTAAVGGHDNANISWSPVAGTASYVVRFKENNPAAAWYEEEANTFNTDLTALEPSTEYLVQVQSVCDETPGIFSSAYSFTTDTLPFDPGAFSCGTQVDSFVAPVNQTPITTLVYGDQVIIGGFSMKITSASQVFNNLWKGTGQVLVPFLGRRVNVKFNGLGVNTDRYVYTGNAFQSGKIEDALNVKSPETIAEEEENEPPRDFCDSIIVASTGAVSGSGEYSIGQNAFNASYNAIYDDYNPKNFYKPYNPDDYSNVNNPYTEERPFPETSLWNPYNVFSSYDPTDYDNPINPWSAAFPYSGEGMLDKVAAFPTTSFPSGAAYGAANLPLNLGVGQVPIIIYKMQFTPTVAKMWTYASVVLPLSGKTVAFKGKGITFHPGGLQGESKMELASNLVIPLKKEVKMTLKKGKKNHITFDCNGPTGIGFDMDVEFCENYVVPVDPVTHTIKPGRVKFNVQGQADDWVHITSAVTMPPFALAKLPDWHFTVTDAILDFSDLTTPVMVKFPYDYQNPKCTTEGTRDQKREGKRSPEWVGIYLGEMTVKLPKKMTRDTLRPIEIGAYGMLIDEVGLTMNLYGTNLIPFNQQTRGDTTSSTPPPPPTSSTASTDTGLGGAATTGANLATNASGVQQSTARNQGKGASAGGWDISLDRLGIGFQYSKFKYVQFEGRVMVPVFDKAMSYAAHIQPPSDTTRGLTFSSSYAFQVGLADTVKMSCMGAKVQLEPNSRVGIAYDGRTDQFYASATFNGRASFNPALSEDSRGTTARDTSVKDRFNIPQIRFQNFSVQTREPYLENIGNWSLEGDTQPDMGGFNIVLNEVGMFSKPTDSSHVKEVAFGVDLTLNLTPSEDSGFGAGGKGYIISTVRTDAVTKRQDWTFKKVRVDKLTVSFESPAFELQGLIKFYENKPVWGTGFKGGISIAVQPGISAAAVAQFGNINGHRYFFADAKVGFTPGLPLGQTGMAIYGFGGGISYGMKRSGRSSATPLPPRDPEDPPPTVATTDDPELDIPAGFFEGEGGFQDPATQPTAELPEASGLQQTFEGGDPANQLPTLISIPEDLGVSLSGARYTPDTTMGIGVKALVAFGTTAPEVFNGDIMLEFVFTSAGGLATIALTGNGRFMTPPKTPENPNPLPQVSAYVDMQFDFIEVAFDAFMEVKVFAAEGVLKGAYPGYVAGIGKIHADANDWWIHIGTPTKPFKLDLDVTELANMNSPSDNNNNNDTATNNNTNDDDDDGPIIPDGFFEGDGGFAEDNNNGQDSSRFVLGEIGSVGLLVSAYFDAGTQIPDFPPVPNEVLSVMPDITRPTANDIANLGGIMGGLHYKVSMPDLRFLIFYADLNAGIGADVMMTNYGTGARCAGNPDATEPIGFNGWYGTGQAYAFLTGALGVKIDFWGSPLQLEVATIGAAAVLQTRLPNPIWIKGQLAGQYSVMNGLVAGRFDFEFEAGETCEIIGARTLEGISVIETVAPATDATDISVFAKPQATFNVPIDGDPIVYKDDDGVYQYAKPILEEITLRDEDDNDITGEVQWSSSKNSVLIRSEEILPPNTALTFALKVRFKVRPASGTDDDYVWLMRGANTFEEEEASVTFTTGAAPTNIPEENVLYAYPTRMQTNFHPQESSTGYVQLDRGQGYLFLGHPGANISAEDYEQKIRFSQPGSTVVDFDVAYNAGEKRVSFAIPPGLNLGSSSSFEILNLPIGAVSAVDVNVDSIRQVVDLQLPEGADPNTSEVIVRKVQAQGVQTGLQETSLYDLPFRTSQYATFIDKINALTDQQTQGISMQLNPTDTIYLDDGTVFITGYRSLDNLRQLFNSAEGFDDLELRGNFTQGQTIQPLVRTEAVLSATGDNWFDNLIRPNIYTPFPYDGISLRRDELPYGIPPIFATYLRVRTDAGSNNLTETDLTGNNYQPATVAYRLDYEIPYRTYSDFGDLQQQVNYRLATGGSLGADQEALSTWDFRVPRTGAYRVHLSYVLPGATSPSSTAEIDLDYTDGPSSKK